ncbi:endonuclease/exonuclease/phosphatase family metal-dependent hydrolase [Nonlabens dokdonensis]|uniref:Endonuclease/exonuclease/phosphatase n=2 Tax=Nonlabens dokdonensis TaxID=328515 RepID=L7WAP7_NONDD|nr:endonuclease/exonuclease/phosphatase family protein [Nonlabens dokdonensis]AGC75968.1 endonuclease/exonuclease/phosphatase [Nonlabens dokdonensis DSW-6]PZX43645.1 endonuclease/exonuclease/phosphatase family metal-dependent hydrolase [Nonlabens dokdonensis]
MSRKHLLLLLFFMMSLPQLIIAQKETSLVSWNIRDFGKTKSAEEIEDIAEILRDYDIIAIQEVVAGYGGSQAVARLADELNRKGSKWDYSISYSTKSPKYKTEKYAFLWKTSKVKVVEKGSLIKELEACVYREPFHIKFKANGNKFTVINYHFRKHSEQPETEVNCISDYILNHKEENIILAGDFNLSIGHSAFNSLKENDYKACLDGDRTTLKRTCKDNNYLNHAIDNILHDSLKNELIECGTIDFVQECDRLEAMRMLSDHLPVFIKFKSNKK